MKIVGALAAVLVVMAGLVAGVEAALIGPLPYSGLAQSPFAGLAGFHLEDFDDHALNTPGVTPSAGAPSTLSGFSGSIIDQVGLSGGCNIAACDTWFAASGNAGVTFTFNKAVLGALPTAAGLVWTDGAGTITFEAFDQNGQSLGTLTGNDADGTFFGTIEEDRFFGATNPGGISAIHISNSSGGIEIDHLQFVVGEVEIPSGVPAPSALLLLGAGVMAAGAARRLFRSR